MSSHDTNFDWRIGYAVFCLIFASWVVYLGLDNFDKVHGEYHQARKRLQKQQIDKISHQELVDQCRTKLKRRGEYRKTDQETRKIIQDPCFSFPPAVLEKKKTVVKNRLHVEQKRFLRKLVVFYISFGIFFLALPLYLLYLLISFLVWVFRDIKILK